MIDFSALSTPTQCILAFIGAYIVGLVVAILLFRR